MAPEEFQGYEATAKSDIFALGAVLYEMLAGRAAFQGADAAAIVAAVCTAAPMPLAELRSDVPPRLDAIVQTCLAKEAQERWADASDLHRELQWTAQEAAEERSRSWGDVRRGAALVAGVAGLLAVAAGVPRIVQIPRLNAAARHVVVLPCDGAAGGDTDRVYCEGIADTLTASLAQFTASQPMQVTPASEVRARGIRTAVDARRALGATLAFEGSVQRAADAVRVTYSLVETATPKQIDAISFTAPARDPFAVHDRLAEWMLQSLEIRAPAASRTQHDDAQVPGAYELYLQARGYLLQPPASKALSRAIELLQRVLVLEPRFAPAHASLGQAYWSMYEITRDEQWVARAHGACEQAVGISRRLPAAYVCQGTIHLGTGEYEEASAAFEAALEREPTSDAAYRGLARAQERLGDHAAAEATFRRAIAVRPGYWAGYDWMGAFYFGRGRYQEAAAAFERAVALAPNNARQHVVLGGTYPLMGEYDAALREYARGEALDPDSRPYLNWGMTLYRQRRFREAAAMLERALVTRTDSQVLGNLARALYWAGDRERAAVTYRNAIAAALRELAVNPRNTNVRAMLAECYARVGEPAEATRYLIAVPSENPHVTIFAAMTVNQLGDRTKAIRWIEHAVARGLPIAELEAWIDLDILRKDAQFASLVERARLQQEADASGR
jgi:tetratricopeptide (TPR) repeat protein